jgi:molybdopterin synthase catalytic subunit
MTAPCLTSRPIDVSALGDAVSDDSHGAVATFTGVVRDHHEGRPVERLEYTAYPEMAESVAADILAEAVRRWPVRVALRHRTGVLAIGDVAVAVAAGGAHRAEAFEACRWVIEEVKVRLPVWKREHYADGSVAWVDPTAPGGSMKGLRS